MKEHLPLALFNIGMAVEAYFLPLLALAQILFFVVFYMTRSSG